MGYAQLGVWGNISWKYELNPFSSLGGDVMTSFLNKNETDQLITDLETDGQTYWKNNGQLWVWGNIPWKYELNPFSGLGGDVRTSLDSETKTHKRGDLKFGAIYLDCCMITCLLTCIKK